MTRDWASTFTIPSHVAPTGVDDWADDALGEKLPGETDVFPFKWTAEEMGRIVQALNRRKSK